MFAEPSTIIAPYCSRRCWSSCTDARVGVAQVIAYLMHAKTLPLRMRGCDSTASSDVRLPPLPPAFHEALTTYNAIILDRFSSYMRRYAGGVACVCLHV